MVARGLRPPQEALMGHSGTGGELGLEHKADSVRLTPTAASVAPSAVAAAAAVAAGAAGAC